MRGRAMVAALMATCAASALVAFTPDGWAVGQDPEPNYRQELEGKRTRLQEFETKAKTLGQGVMDLQAERRKLNDQLVETAARIQESESKMTAIEARLGELGEQEKILRGSLAQQHGQIARLLGSLQRMGRNPPPVMMTHRDDALAMVRSAILMASAFPGLRDTAKALSARLDELVRVMSDIRSEGDRLKAEAQRLKDARLVLSGLLSEKKETITQRQAELVAVQKAAAEISRNVTDLGELISKLDEAVRKNTALEEHNKRIAAELKAEEEARAKKQAELQPPAAPAQPAGTAAARVPDLSSIARQPDAAPIEDATGYGSESASASSTTKKRVAILQPKSRNSMRGSTTDRIEPAVPFAKARGLLPPPTRGKRLLSFGSKTEYGGESKGIVFETRAQAQITSPCDGWIVFAGEFRSYGQILIINAGGEYHILLSGLAHIDVQPGQFVLAGEPVGTMGDAFASNPGSKQSGGPPLYVEFRKNDKPIDPDPWWVKAPEKVQG